MLTANWYDVAKAEHEAKLREAEMAHRVSGSAMHSRPQSMPKGLQSLIKRM